jgi:cytochrome P450
MSQIAARDPYIDMTSEAFLENPYPSFLAARAHDPVYFSRAQNCWFFTGYEDVQAGLKDRRLGPLGNTVASSTMSRDPKSDSRFAAMYQRWILTRDDAAHTRLRVLMTKAFTPRAVMAFLPRVHGIVEELFAELLGRGSMDFMNDFAYQLPMIVIAELMGIEPRDRKALAQWVMEVLPLIDVGATPEQARRGDVALAKVDDYLTQVVEARRREPQDSMLDALIAAEAAGDRLTTEELVANVFLVFVAGYETTTSLLGNGLYALLQNPAQRVLLQNNPALIENAVEEFLRIDTPPQMLRRGTYEDVVYGGHTIPKGSLVVLCLAAANRDPQRFPNPDVLDVERKDIRSLAFGNGMHSCLGAHLARHEARIAFEHILSKMPNVALAEEPQLRPLRSLRGFSSLKITF